MFSKDSFFFSMYILLTCLLEAVLCRQLAAFKNPKTMAPLDTWIVILMVAIYFPLLVLYGLWLRREARRQGYIVRMDRNLNAPTRCHHKKHDTLDSQGNVTY